MEGEGAPSAAARAQTEDKMWSTRLAGMQAIDGGVGELDDTARTPLAAELTLFHLERVAKDEKNLQVLVQGMHVIKAVCETFGVVGRRSGLRAIRVAVERLGTKQTKPAACEALHAVAEACGPSWAVKECRSAALAHKNPKVLLDALGWAKEAVEAFGVPQVAPAEPVAFALGAAEHRDAPVRELALQLVVSVRRCVGPLLLASPLLKDAKSL